MLVTFFVEKASKVLVVELNTIVLLLLDATDFLTNNKLLEINETVFNLKALLLDLLLVFTDAVDVPSHEWVAQYYLT